MRWPLEAPDTATAGGSISVRLIGDLTSGTGITIVRTGTPVETGGILATVSRGSDQTLTIGRLPTMRGEYEIRLVNVAATGRHIYAGKTLTIQ